MSAYFQQLNQTLKNYDRAIPCLLLDLDRVDKNIATLNNNLRSSASFRIAVKSLPSFELVHYIMQKASTNKLMVFHQPFMTDLVAQLDEQADLLLGKPMPIKTAAYFYEHLPDNTQNFNPFRQIQWLVDTPNRILEYIALAKKIGQSLRLNLEIDVGLHRGGFMDTAQLTAALKLIEENNKYVNFSGLMGYDPQVVKLPKIVRSQSKALALANEFYQQCKTIIRKEFPALWQEDLTFNGAGSPTMSLHQGKDSPLNDITAGSCLVKPTTFDLPTLADYEAACYIATPVLKKFEGTTLPAMESAKSLLNLMSSNNRQSYFIYGGFWKADYCFPEGTQQNSIFSASTNQTMLNTPTASLAIDDFVFLRPHQSEFVLLQFGNILRLRNGAIEGTWQVLKNY